MHIAFNLGNVLFIVAAATLGALALVALARIAANTQIPVAKQIGSVTVKLFNLESAAAAQAA